MKISNASKKVLASALSAAMVVAFAPTVAFGAQAGNKVKVQYDLGTGTDTAADFQGAISTQEYTVANGTFVAAHVVEAADGDYIKVGTILEPNAAKWEVPAGTANEVAVNGVKYAKAADLVSSSPWADADQVKYVAKTDGTKLYNYVADAGTPGATVTLENGDNLKLNSGATKYNFKEWKVTFDADGDGAFDHAAQGDIDAAKNGGAALDVSHANIHDGATISAKAVYDTATIAANALTLNNNGDADHKFATLTFNKSSVTEPTKAINGYTVEVAGPGSTVTLSSTDTDSNVTVPAAVGEYTVTLKDGNGTVLDTQKTMVGSVVLTGAFYKNIYTAGNTYVGAQTIFYKATDEKQVISDILSASGVASAYTTPYKKVDTATPETGSLVGTSAKVAAGAVSTEVAASFASDKASILGMAYAAGEVSIAYNNLIINGTAAGAGWIAKGQNFNAPATSDETGYYLVVKDADGKIVKETAKTSADDKAFASLGYTGTLTFAATGSSSYTATLYKVTAATAGTAGLSDGTAGTVEDLGSKTVEVKAVAAPTWTYAANEKVADGGTLTLANAAGEGFVVKYNTGSGVRTYDTTKGGIAKVTADTLTIWAEASASNTKADPRSSEVVTLKRYTTTKTNFDNWATSYVGYKAVNGAATTYYGNVAGVKAAIEAADKGFVATGYKAVTGGTEWNADMTAAKKSVIEAVAATAKNEAAKMYAGVENKDGSVSKISEDNYSDAVKAIEKVVSDFAANHDTDTANNVAKNGEIAYSDANGSYVDAIDAALKAASKSAVKYAKADVDAAAAVTKSLKEAKTADEAKAAIEAYGNLNATQKELVAKADVAAAQEIVTKAELAEAQDEAAIAKVKGKTVKAKAKKATKSSLKVVTSKSGAKSTFKKVTKNSKVTVSKSGKITVKKGLKAGKTYTVKVKATVGTQTKTVKVVVKVAK